MDHKLLLFFPSCILTLKKRLRIPVRNRVTTRLQCLGFLAFQEDFCHTYCRVIIFNAVYKYSSQNQQRLQDRNAGIRDSCRNLPWFLHISPKWEILRGWIPLCWKVFWGKSFTSVSVTVQGLFNVAVPLSSSLQSYWPYRLSFVPKP